MIQGITRSNRTEQQYRQLELDSSSSLQDYVHSPLDYYRKYVLGEKPEEKDSWAVLVGRLVHTLLLEPENLEHKFHISTVEKLPTKNMLDFTMALFKHRMQNTGIGGELLVDFSFIAERAREESGYEIALPAILKKFQQGTGEAYYEELLQARPRNLQVVTVKDMANAEKIVEELRSTAYTADIVNQQSDEHCEVFHELQLEGFQIDGLPMKGMLDKIVVDHRARSVQVTDVKVCWAVQNFYNEYYLKRYSYIQAGVYDHAAHLWTEQHYPDYRVLPIQFLVADSSGYYQPLIYRLTAEDLIDAYSGFTERGWYYPGVGEIIKNLQWNKQNNTWRIPRTAFLSGGIVPLKERRA